MNDDPLAALQPDAGGQPTPPTPPAPSLPEPPTPPVNGSGDDGSLTEAEKADAAEWEQVADELFPGLKSANENKDGQDGKAKPDQSAQEDGANKEAAQNQKPNESAEKGAGTPPAKPDGKDTQHSENKGDDTADEASGTDGEENEPPEPTAASARLSAREQQQQLDDIKADVQQKLFVKEVDGKRMVEAPDGTNYHLDNSGKPILADKNGERLDSIDKVMQYINPTTGERFTEEEAGMWLLNAQRQLDQNVRDMNARIEQVADTNIAIKDEADLVNWQYGELLRAMPELRAKLWAEYEKTLEKDPKSGIITRARSSLRNFYEVALEPYAQLGRRLEADEAAKTASDAQAAQTAKQQEVQQRQQRRADRSDIYSGGKTDTMSDEEKEWAQAAEAVFGKIS